MAYPPITLFFLILLPFFIESCPTLINYSCPDFHGTSMMFPFTNTSLPDCGFCVLECTHNSTTFHCGQQNLSYKTKAIFPRNKTVVLTYPSLNRFIGNVCLAHQTDSVTIPNPPLTNFTILHLMVFFRCPSKNGPLVALQGPPKTCGDDIVYGPYLVEDIPDGLHEDCSTIKLPNSTNDDFSIVYRLPDDCSQCASDTTRCFDQTTNRFFCPKQGNDSPKNRRKHPTIILFTGGCLLIITLGVVIIYWRKRKNKPGSSTLASGIMSFHRTTSDLEEGTVNGGVTVFSYNELVEATNNFDPTKELGEGGFGVVYHGKLRDGREVAVKRLFEKNFKRIEQFKNEIKILTDLRHKNLVTLFGCTTRHSRELLLVYEYIPNGTVADHLHGDHPDSQFITWSTRMKIAIETAEALTYLHYEDIIHRDVKTNNILLDNNFSVKVADFGLSRLFPADVTHVSTAPQGTPGYLDPEYHQCYHLTDRSDVYSFGVVLIELLSSLPAVDIGRHRYEINLSNYAIIKIQGRAFKELVDPRLGFDTDLKVKRMTTLVAELAFQCLQHERDLRPSMDEVLCDLKRIVSLDYDALEAEEMEMRVENKEFVKNAQRSSSLPGSVTEKWLSRSMKRPPSLRISLGKKKPDSSTEKDDAGLLRNAQKPLPTSPASVMDNWSSQASTPNTSS